MKQLFFYELKQNVTRNFLKNYFQGEHYEKVFPTNIVVNRNFYIFQSIFKINNSFTINKIYHHFENFNHACHFNSEENKANTNKQQITLQQPSRKMSVLAFLIEKIVVFDQT